MFLHTKKKGFLIPTKSFIKIGITKIFCYNKMFSAAAKFLVEATKNLFVVPNFVAVTIPFFRAKYTPKRTL